MSVESSSGRMIGRAFSLLEVMVAMGLMASVLTAVMVIRARLIEQCRHASKVARANVLAGRLVAEWTNGVNTLDPGQERKGLDPQTGFRWLMCCSDLEVEPGIRLKCLKVSVYEGSDERHPILAFDAWSPPD